MEGEGTVVTAGVAYHPNQLQLTPLSMLVCHPVEELMEHTHTRYTHKTQTHMHNTHIIIQLHI